MDSANVDVVEKQTDLTETTRDSDGLRVSSRNTFTDTKNQNQWIKDFGVKLI